MTLTFNSCHFFHFYLFLLFVLAKSITIGAQQQISILFRVSQSLPPFQCTQPGTTRILNIIRLYNIERKQLSVYDLSRY